ncbi:MAG: membrane protein insertion efficiency factor YidD [Lautropia sp.]|nr:membrane protein insertion efficiency factor YidD [Lautropia sp.]
MNGRRPRPLVRALMAMVRGYQLGVGSIMTPSCRYVPSCSEYALDALRLHGAGRGSWLTLKRVCRCHPWGGHGFDPVPPIRGDGDDGDRQPRAVSAKTPRG